MRINVRLGQSFCTSMHACLGGTLCRVQYSTVQCDVDKKIKMAGNVSGTSGSGCNVSVTVNNGSSNTRRVGGGSEQVTINYSSSTWFTVTSVKPESRAICAQSAMPVPVPTQRVLATVLDGRGQVSGKKE